MVFWYPLGVEVFEFVGISDVIVHGVRIVTLSVLLLGMSAWIEFGLA